MLIGISILQTDRLLVDFDTTAGKIVPLIQTLIGFWKNNAL